MAENETPQTQATETKARRIRKVRTGVVTSAKRTKTVTVTVKRRVKHKRYSKYLDRENNFHAHDEIGCKEGDVVRIEETRPLSKTKRWRVVAKLEKGA